MGGLEHGTTISKVPRQLVYGHFVYDTSSTDISSTDISSTTVYQCVGQLYIQFLFQQIIIFINPASTDTMLIQHIQLASIAS